MTTAVFRGYDRAALDAEYDNRAKVKQAIDWITRYGAESARARAELPMRFDVPYGRHHGERLDIFPAAGEAAAPVHFFVHGGYWHRLDKADFSFVVRPTPASSAAIRRASSCPVTRRAATWWRCCWPPTGRRSACPPTW